MRFDLMADPRQLVRWLAIRITIYAAVAAAAGILFFIGASIYALLVK